MNYRNLQPFTRVRVTRCWSLLAFMPDFAVLYSLKCQSLLPPFLDSQPDDRLIASHNCRGLIQLHPTRP